MEILTSFFHELLILFLLLLSIWDIPCLTINFSMLITLLASVFIDKKFKLFNVLTLSIRKNLISFVSIFTLLLLCFYFGLLPKKWLFFLNYVLPIVGLIIMIHDDETKSEKPVSPETFTIDLTTPTIQLQVGYGLMCALQDSDRVLDQLDSLKQKISRRYGVQLRGITICDNLSLGVNEYRWILGQRLVSDLSYTTRVSDLPERTATDFVMTNCADFIESQIGSFYDPNALANRLQQYAESRMNLKSVSDQIMNNKAYFLNALHQLICEQVPLSSFDVIVRVMLDQAAFNLQDMVEHARYAVRKQILENLNGPSKKLKVVVLSDELERLLLLLLETDYVDKRSPGWQLLLRRLEDAFQIQYARLDQNKLLIVKAEHRMKIAKNLVPLLNKTHVIADIEVLAEYSLDVVEAYLGIK